MSRESSRNWFGWRRKPVDRNVSEGALEAGTVLYSGQRSPAERLALGHHVDTDLSDRIEAERRQAVLKAQHEADLAALEHEAGQQARRETDERLVREAEPLAEILQDPNSWVNAQDLVNDLEEHPDAYRGKFFVVRVETATQRRMGTGPRKTNQTSMVKVMDIALYPDFFLFFRERKRGAGETGMLRRFIPGEEHTTIGMYEDTRSVLTQRDLRLFTDPSKLIRYVQKREARAPGKKKA